jgi:hypothetical protein
MKYHGSLLEFSRERAQDLLQAYFRQLAAAPYIRMPDIYRAVAAAPARRFYVSTPRAAAVIAAMTRGDTLDHMCPNKRDMFYEIYRRYTRLRQRHPRWSCTRLCREIVEQPAPKFYISPGTARILIINEKKRHFKRSR